MIEILNPNSVDLTKVDIFALGASIYELARCVPLPANGKEWVAIRDGYLNEQALKNRQDSDEFIALLKVCVVCNTHILHSHSCTKIQQRGHQHGKFLVINL
jgi:hypothetical protein